MAEEFYSVQTPPSSAGPVERVQGSAIARELADIEAPAQDARIRREKELQREHDTGLTDKERENLRLMEGLKEKYPDAFTDLVDTQGRKLMLVKHNSAQESLGRSDALFTQEGHVYLQPPANTNTRWKLGEFDFTPVVDLVQNASGTISMAVSLARKDKVSLSAVDVRIGDMDLTKEGQADDMRELLTEVQKFEKDRQEKTFDQANAATAEALLAKL